MTFYLHESRLKSQILNALLELLGSLNVPSLGSRFEQIEFRDRRSVIYYVTVRCDDAVTVRVSKYAETLALIGLDAPDSLDLVVETVRRLSEIDYPSRVKSRD